MIVRIRRNETSQPIVIDCENAYTKGPMYCVLVENKGERNVRKFPLCTIFEVVEEYCLTKRKAGDPSSTGSVVINNSVQ